MHKGPLLRLAVGVLAGCYKDSMTGTHDANSLHWLLDHTLPLNRKERYYTGTVLPGIVCADDMTHLHRLTNLMGVPGVDVSGDPDDCGLVFFTEYGVAESVYGPARDRFDDLPADRDTPDVVFLATRPNPTLFALEAKLYDRPSGFDLKTQLNRQAKLLADLATRLAVWLEVPQVPVAHYALLPTAQAGHDFGYPVLTWQQLQSAYADVGPAYWLAMLDEALSRYDDLVTRPRPNDEDRLTGDDIVEQHHAGTATYTFMGRTGGIAGTELLGDIKTGKWRTTIYQVASTHPGNRNWFPTTEFVALANPADINGIERLTAALHHAQAVGTRLYAKPTVTDDGASPTDLSVLQQLLAATETLRDVPDHELNRVAALYEAATQAGADARAAANDLLSRKP